MNIFLMSLVRPCRKYDNLDQSIDWKLRDFFYIVYNGIYIYMLFIESEICHTAKIMRTYLNWKGKVMTRIDKINFAHNTHNCREKYVLMKTLDDRLPNQKRKNNIDMAWEVIDTEKLEQGSVLCDMFNTNLTEMKSFEIIK